MVLVIAVIGRYFCRGNKNEKVKIPKELREPEQGTPFFRVRTCQNKSKETATVCVDLVSSVFRAMNFISGFPPTPNFLKFGKKGKTFSVLAKFQEIANKKKRPPPIPF